MKLSYNEACALECSTLEQDLALCEKVGFDYIEMRFDMLRTYLATHTVQNLVDFFASHRLKSHAFNALYLYPDFLSDHDDEEKQKSLMADFHLACMTGREIGSHYVIVVPPLQRDPKGGPYAGKWEDTFGNCVRILRDLSERAAEYAMNLCFEPVGFERSSVRSVEQADAIVRAVNKKNVGFTFDSYNIYLNGGANDFSAIKAVQTEKIFAVHLMSGDDVPPEERGQDKRCFCGQGVVDVDSFLKTLASVGYDGMVSVETFRPEYWQKPPRWVVGNAYRTTRAALERAGCA